MSIDLTQGHIPKQLLKMSGPMMIGILSIMAMYFADSYFIAKLGVEPLAAVGFVLPMINILSALGFGFGSSASALISRSFGADDTSALKQYASQILFLSFIHAILFSLLGYFFAEKAFKALGAPERLIPDIMAYANVWFYGCFLVIIPIVGNSIIRATGNTRMPGVIMLSISLVNIALDPLLIFGWGPIPAMGVAGAAVASIIAYSVACICALYFLWIKLDYFKFKYFIRPNVQILKAISRLAYPSVLTNLMVPITVAVTTVSVAQYGIDAIAGLNIAMRLESFTLVPLFGLASVVGPFIGQNLGAGQLDRIQQGLYWATKTVVLYGLTIYCLLLFFGNYALSIFHITKFVQLEGMKYIALVGWSYFCTGIIVVTNASANALSKPIFAVMINFGRLLALYIPFLLIVYYFRLGVTGVYISLALSSLLMACLALYFWKSLGVLSD